MPNILLTTLGGSWEVVPEAWGVLNTEKFDLYQNHIRWSEINQLRHMHGLYSVNEIWCVTTSGKHIKSPIEKIMQWAKLCGVSVRCWKLPCEDINSYEDCLYARELIYRLVLHARAKTLPDDHLYLSLAGGRKTMSADLQRAATLFGCDLILHVVVFGNDKIDLVPEILASPLNEDTAKLFTPFVIGAEPGEEVLRLTIPDQDDIVPDRYPLPDERSDTDDTDGLLDNSLQRAVEFRLKQNSNLIVNFIGSQSDSVRWNTFPQLLHLPPHLIQELRNLRIGNDPGLQNIELELLRKLPKTDLHCHLGGICSSSDIVQVAKANNDLVEQYIHTTPKLRKSLQSWQKAIVQGKPQG